MNKLYLLLMLWFIIVGIHAYIKLNYDVIVYNATFAKLNYTYFLLPAIALYTRKRPSNSRDYDLSISILNKSILISIHSTKLKQNGKTRNSKYEW